jgi:hypothetical protein
MTYHLHFGDLDIAEGVANRLQTSVADAALSILRYRAEILSGEVLFRVAKFDLASECYRRSFATATAIGLHRGQIAAGTYLTHFFWCTNDRIQSEEWFQITSDNVSRSSAPSYIAGHYSNAIVRALDAERPTEAHDLLAQARRTAPQVNEGSHGHLGLAYEIRIGIALGRPPTQGQVDALLQAYRESVGFLGKDYIVDTLIEALNRSGRAAEVNLIRTEYLETWRRERYPVPNRLLNLLSTTQS